jgi:hypothetical protein
MNGGKLQEKVHPRNTGLQVDLMAIRLENTIDSSFCDFRMGRLLNGAGIRKMRQQWTADCSPAILFATVRKNRS